MTTWLKLFHQVAESLDEHLLRLFAKMGSNPITPVRVLRCSSGQTWTFLQDHSPKQRTERPTNPKCGSPRTCTSEAHTAQDKSMVALSLIKKGSDVSPPSKWCSNSSTDPRRVHWRTAPLLQIRPPATNCLAEAHARKATTTLADLPPTGFQRIYCSAIFTRNVSRTSGPFRPSQTGTWALIRSQGGPGASVSLRMAHKPFHHCSSTAFVSCCPPPAPPLPLPFPSAVAGVHAPLTSLATTVQLARGTRVATIQS